MLFRLLVLACLAFISFTFAQTDQTRVTVRLPSMLKLELDGLSGNRVTVPLFATVVHDAYSLSQETSNLRIVALGAWQLLVGVEGTPAAIKMQVRLDGSNRPFQLSTFPKSILTGSSTQGWETHTVNYALARPLPPDGSYLLKVIYTLVRP